MNTVKPALTRCGIAKNGTFGIAEGIGFCSKRWSGSCQRPSRRFGQLTWGGGLGGWVRYLADRRGEHFKKIALADSSQVALTMAGNILPPGVDRYQINLMNLGWEDEWDIAFMCKGFGEK
jgi:hypothetical protein